jgi:methylthioribose-1-phosphate isomerase
VNREKAALRTLEFKDGSLWLIDQTKLPMSPGLIECREYDQVIEAIQSLRVRGAPAIGLAAAYGVVLAAQSLAGLAPSREEYSWRLDEAIEQLRRARPTAVNLSWALNQMRRVIKERSSQETAQIIQALLDEANEMLRKDEQVNLAIGRHGAELISDGANILTHCNTGALATGAFGTALGVFRTAHQSGKRIHVWVDETRPLLQGARLTTWELKDVGIPFTLITDSMAGHFMAQGKIDLVMVGADRIVANGDAANKIGTYSAAVLARAHDIPFYFVAPISTIDLATPSGAEITIEQRNPEEVTSFAGMQVAPEGTVAANPAFDVTPSRLITAIVTERGVVRLPFKEGLAKMVEHPPRPESLQQARPAGAEAV